jgi:hypothetical protein
MSVDFMNWFFDGIVGLRVGEESYFLVRSPFKIFVKIMKRIFLIGGLAIAIGFAVANVGVTKQDIKMSLFLENAIALSTESTAPANKPCYTQVISQSETAIFVRKCAAGTGPNGSNIKPCNNNLIETQSGYFSNPDLCSSTENTTP